MQAVRAAKEMNALSDVAERVEMSTLLDFYGPLLTEHRRELMRLYCDEDLSLAEIAEQAEITRQGVSDVLNKTRRQLCGYEAKLGLARRYRAIRAQAQAGLQALDTLEDAPGDPERLSRIRQALENIIQIER